MTRRDNIATSPLAVSRRLAKLASSEPRSEDQFQVYDLRHKFATRAVASGADLPTLSALLGHASTLTTMRYVHPSAEQKRMATEKLEKFRAEGVISATVAAQQSHGATTKVTTVERVI